MSFRPAIHRPRPVSKQMSKRESKETSPRSRASEHRQGSLVGWDSQIFKPLRMTLTMLEGTENTATEEKSRHNCFLLLKPGLRDDDEFVPKPSRVQSQLWLMIYSHSWIQAFSSAQDVSSRRS